MSKIHLTTNGSGAVKCGAETPWRNRLAKKPWLQLRQSKDLNEVTCANCRR